MKVYFEDCWHNFSLQLCWFAISLHVNSKKRNMEICHCTNLEQRNVILVLLLLLILFGWSQLKQDWWWSTKPCASRAVSCYDLMWMNKITSAAVVTANDTVPSDHVTCGSMVDASSFDRALVVLRAVSLKSILITDAVRIAWGISGARRTNVSQFRSRCSQWSN